MREILIVKVVEKYNLNSKKIAGKIPKYKP